MKRILILFTLVLAAATTFAQSAKRVSAYNYMSDGEFLKAKEPIDEAITDSKTGVDDKTWRYRGQIYTGLAQNDYEGIDKADAIKTAIESFEKAMELDVKNKWKQENLSGLAQAQNLAVNMGIAAYNASEFEKSANLFLVGEEAAANLGVVDTLALYNAGLAAEQAGNFEMALTQYRKATEINYLGAKMYLYMANLYQRQEDTDGYLAIIQEGRKAYPEDADLIVYELNYYLQSKKFDEAKNNLLLAIEKEPDNKQLYFSLGVVYQELGNTEEAVKAYKKAIEIDPEYFDAVYNLGAFYFNNGVEMNNAANEIEDNKAYEAKRAEAKAEFEKGLPHLEKAHQLDPTDVGAMASLQQLYALLEMTDKYQEMKTKLESAKAE
ncbi:tetratricopeptide repeat protein [Cryomorphaceae bacterium 1068]|nr:tetratricopeptide repeat protein [Cryomorphaceae bacterium 1068]